ncbi:hypothetical protein AVEN_185080-1 [Araneus ventricosus]|uniref:Uncharacterized protein n=1 Tax=Araneus ventricosus TaxID=182803 RepID=A0A4Y2BR46_ARAVE|nr:hypothetical protein AVEN_185080-1 [Araneus ventricosus]
MLINLSQVVSHSPQRQNTYIVGSSTLLSEKYNTQSSYRVEQPKSHLAPSLPKISLTLACGGRSVPKFTGTPGFNAHEVVPPNGLKRDVAKLCATTAELSDLEPRSTTEFINSW